MAEIKTSNGKKFSDVARPNTSAPSETSRPVIVTNRAVMQDPMVVGGGNTSDAPPSESAPSAPPLPTKSSTKVKLQPLITTAAPVTSEQPATPKVEAESTTESTTPPAPTEVTPEPADTPEKSTPPNTPTEASPTDQPPAVDLEGEAAAEAEKAAHLQKVVDSKQYFLPINSVEKRRTKRVVMMGVVLSLILAVVWVDVALDAGLIHVAGIKPVTHFFSN